MKTIRHTTTLVYYDGPQVWEARDAIGGHYIVVMVEPDDERDRYLVAGVEPERLRQFRTGSIDLLSLLLERHETEWFLASPTEEQELTLALEPQDAALVNFPQLPEPGFLLYDRSTETETLKEARSRNTLVLEVVVAPPESAEEHRIRTDTLAGLLMHLQTIVKHAYNAALRELPHCTRQKIDRPNAHVLDVVVPAAAGSFRIVMEAAKIPDLFGGCELSRALERMDDLFANVSNPQATLDHVRKHRGHLAGSYLRLLRFLVQNKSGLYYAWAEPTFTEIRKHTISEVEAEQLVAVLSGVSNLGAETVVLIGALKKADVDSGAWRIATAVGEVSGKIKDGGPSLAGLKLEDQYRFTCLEEIEEDSCRGRERRILYLTEYEPVNRI